MKLLDRLLKRPALLLAVLLLLSVLLLPLLRRVNLQGDLVDLLPRSSVAAQTFATYQRNLAAGQELVILATCADPDQLVKFADSYAEALRGLGLAGEDIERCKRGGEAAGLEVLPRMVQVSEAIAADIQRSLDFFRGAVADEPLSRIVLCGGSALVPSLRAAAPSMVRCQPVSAKRLALVLAPSRRSSSTGRHCAMGATHWLA